MEKIKVYHLLYFVMGGLILLSWLDMAKILEYPTEAIKYHSFEMTVALGMWGRIEQKIINS